MPFEKYHLFACSLEEENTKLKRMYADVSLENMAMKDLFSKKGW